jgi:conserved oligomeric Golgi complex subunit 4
MVSVADMTSRELDDYGKQILSSSRNLVYDMVHPTQPGNAAEILEANGTEHSPAEATPRVDPRKLTTLPEIMSCLSSFQSEEVELSNSLTQLLSVREPILASLSRLQSLVPRVEELHLEASQLSNKVSSTAETAERIGGRVRALDEEMRRVREGGERVSQVMELKVRPTIILTHSS